MEDIADLMGSAGVLTAQNRASEEMTARICADTDMEGGGTWDSRAAVP